MNAILSKVMSVLVFPSARRRAWRARARISKLSKNNEIDVCEEVLPRIKLKVVGTGNRIVVRRPLPGNGILSIVLVGNGCNVEIGEKVSIGQALKISIGNQHKDLGPVEDVNVSIGRGVGFNGDATIMTYNSHARVEIGDESLFGPGVMVYQTDGHPVYDLATGRITNHVRTLHIGKHVWIGARATLLKNVFVPDGCIVGLGSVVTGRFAEANCVISGNPAACMRKGVAWKWGDPEYVANRVVM